MNGDNNMNGDNTFSMIKPDAIQRKYQGLIIDKILQNGFKIVAMKMCKLNKNDAQKFYFIHKDKAFFDSLIQFITSGPIIALALKKNNAVEDFRTLIGATNPQQADKNTIRAAFAQSIEHNAIHGSDSDDNALTEISFFFPTLEILD